MLDALRRLRGSALRHRYGFATFSYLAAAIATGVVCVLFMRAFEAVLTRRVDFASAGAWPWLLTPLVILLSVEAIRRLAPAAEGAGIPQTVFASEHLSAKTEAALAALTSWRTLAVKVISLLAVLWVGASTGREGPTVHVAACVFLGVVVAMRRWSGLPLDARSAVIAGGAAGLAAAFNTPLAGVTFAVEELSSGYFTAIKDFVLMAIVFAAIAAKSMTGEYSYFGSLAAGSPPDLPAVLLTGVLGGLLGGAFSTALHRGRARLAPLESGAGRYLLPVLLSLGLLAVAKLAGPRVLGPGNAPASLLVAGEWGSWVPLFPLAKAAATLLTYWAGAAGGIFAPCLSMGAALGAETARWLGAPTGALALVGMAAFLSGTIQAPITAFVIIFEMTGRHEMLLPVMLGSLLAFMFARLLGAKHLYHELADRYAALLEPAPPAR